MDKFLVIYRHPSDGMQFSYIETELPDSKDPADFELPAETEILAVIGTQSAEEADASVTIENIDLWLEGEQVLPA